MLPIRTNNRKAISVVMTTMIILVASVVLATGVVIYGTSLFQTGGQTQSISSQGIKLWVNGTSTNGYSWGAAAIRNNGDVLATVNTIQIRGVVIPFSNWYVSTNTTNVNPNFQASFIEAGTNATGFLKSNMAYGGATSTFCSPVTNVIQLNENGTSTYNGKGLCLQQASGPTTLTPGGKMIIYFRVPNNVLGPVDAGSTITVNIFAGNVGGPATVTVGNT
jgi:hypothetical protein